MWITSILLLPVLLVGCRPASQPPPGITPEQPQVDAQQQQVMQDLLAFLKETGSSMEGLRDDLRQMRTREEDPGGIRTLGEDLRVSRALMAAARKGAADKSAEQCRAALERLRPALMAVRSNLPAARMTQELERALQAISSYQAEQAINVAGLALQRATALALHAPPALAPTVTREVELAKSAVGKADLAGASKQLQALLPRLRGEDSLRVADRALAAAEGAQAALAQEAWLVVEAQLDYLDSLLSSLQQKVEGALTPVTPEPEAEAGEQLPAAESTGSPAPAAGGTTPSPPTGAAAPAAGSAAPSGTP